MVILADPGVEIVEAGCRHRDLVTAELHAVGPDPGIIGTALVERACRCSVQTEKEGIFTATGCVAAHPNVIDTGGGELDVVGFPFVNRRGVCTSAVAA